MSRKYRGLVVALAALLAGAVLVGSTPEQSTEFGGAQLTSVTRTKQVIAVRYAGRFANHSDDPTHFVFTGPITTMTGEVLGEMTHDVACSRTAPPPCLVADAVNTFRFADGTIVNHGRESLPPDPQHPDHLLAGNHPPDKSIVSTTGAYAGRTGTAHSSGRHDGSELPGFVTFDDFWLIELDY